MQPRNIPVLLLGKFPLQTQLEISALETTRSEISQFSDEVHTKLTTAKEKLKLAISQGSTYRRQNEKLTNDLSALQSEFEKEKSKITAVPTPY